MQFSPVSCNFLPLTSKYSLQRCLRQTGMVLPQCTRSSFTNVIKYLNKSLRKKVAEHSRVETAVTLAPLPFPIFCANAMLKNSAVLRRAVKYHIGNTSVPVQNPSKVSQKIATPSTKKQPVNTRRRYQFMNIVSNQILPFTCQL